MLLCIDIGNTNIKCAIYNNDDLITSVRIATDLKKTADEYSVDFYTLLKVKELKITNINNVIISSVVPSITGKIERAIKQVLNAEVMIVGPGIKTGLNIQIDDPAELGADLVVASVAASNLFSSPSIVISMGTATAMCVIDENKTMKGGIIAPGVNISLEALTQRSALLPSIELKAPKSTIGKNTTECMKSGVVLGAAAMIDGMIDKIEKELNKKCTVIATGGIADSIIPNCSHDIKVDNDLIIKGLKIIYNKQKI